MHQKASYIHSRHRYYEHRDKIGRQLAHQIRLTEASRHITEICRSSGNTTKKWIKNLNNFTLNYIQQKYPLRHNDMYVLEEPITLDEITLAIRSFQSSKALGPDGYTAEFFKTFTVKIAPLLLKVFNKLAEKSSLPAKFFQAIISLIHKKRKGSAWNCNI